MKCSYNRSRHCIHYCGDTINLQRELWGAGRKLTALKQHRTGLAHQIILSCFILWWLCLVLRAFIWFIYPYCPSCFADTGPSASKATLRDMGRANCTRPQQSKPMCMILGIYCGRGWRIRKSTFFNGWSRMGKLKTKFRLAQQIGSDGNKPSKYPLN